jgi:sulfur carrier protein ThiS
MARVHFTSVIQRHVECPETEVDGATVREALEGVFRTNAALRGYLLDDQGALRQHVALFVDGEQIKDRARQGDPVGARSRIDVMQALSGG